MSTVLAQPQEMFDTQGWTNIDLETSVSITDLSLSHGQEHFISVRGIDKVENVGSHSSQMD